MAEMKKKTNIASSSYKAHFGILVEVTQSTRHQSFVKNCLSTVWFLKQMRIVLQTANHQFLYQTNMGLSNDIRPNGRIFRPILGIHNGGMKFDFVSQVSNATLQSS
ncbi:hypothetical protein CEXT_489881 [Caerostris extrusa]|uniref:Uncharacterized protein n=1 Tax=Caerostris extrusa TaxID=172846 RepID=A0AAV4WA04_CAEEX|nr:hypothetical protein CEXT_489881 [Caerostris extrusa]